jgi:sulfatase maturation enzyme AslB (radical SAM superfamily)
VLTNFYGSKHNVFNDLQSKTKTNDSLALLTYKDSQYLNEIKVTGGEPFLTDSFLKFLENLVEWGIAKNIVLDVFTNSSFFPKEKHTQMLTKFKQVDINLSIDAVGERNDFLRKKSKWQVVQDVAKRWEELSIQNNNISIRISHTVTIFNSLYLDEFLNWCNTHFDKKTINSDFVHVAVAYGPDYLSVRNFSRPIKEKLLQIVTKQWNESNRLFSKSLVDQKFKRIVTALDSTDSKDPIDSVFEEKTEMFDKIRNEDWRTTFPKLAEVFNE